MFAKISKEKFEEFHREFQGDTYSICNRCGGKCELQKIGSLMPGEAEYLASRLGISNEDFKNQYLDGIQTPHGVVDVLKMRPGCPFLTPDFSCGIRNFKVVLCAVYPIVFEVKGEDVDFFLDDWCPIVRHLPEATSYFNDKGIPALKNLGAPVEWYRAVELFDPLCVDYERLFELRKSQAGYTVLTLEQIESCQVEGEDRPDLLTPSQV